MVPLDRGRADTCQHEIDIVMQEGLAFRELSLHFVNHDDLIREYRESRPDCG